MRTCWALVWPSSTIMLASVSIQSAAGAGPVRPVLDRAMVAEHGGGSN